MKIAIVSGSRHWRDRDAIWEALDDERPDVLIEGGQVSSEHQLDDTRGLREYKRVYFGADWLAAQWAHRPGSPVRLVTVPALWKGKRRRGDGPARNSFMIQTGDAYAAMYDGRIDPGWLPQPLGQQQPTDRVVIAAPLPGGSGTQDLLRKARKAGWRIRLVEGASE